MKFNIPPLIQLLVCGLIGWGLSRILPILDFAGRWPVTIAFFLFLAGAIILILSLRAFISARTTVNPVSPEKTETLVTSGLYRISRNPMYLAMAAILTGGAFLIGDLAAFAGPVLFVWVMTKYQIRAEEQALKEKFGEAFSAYCRRTRRWI